MKSASTYLLIAGVVGALSGCSMLSSTTPSESEQSSTANSSVMSVAQLSDCCSSMSQFSFQPLAKDADVEADITSQTPVYSFADGKSHFVAYQLPRDLGSFYVSIKSVVENKKVFAPQVLLLNKNFEPVRMIRESDFQYQPSKFLEKDALVVRFKVERSYRDDPANEVYMVVKTTDKAVAGTTQMIHPAKLAAKTQHRAIPDIADPIAQHAETGHLAITVGDVNLGDRITTSIGGWLLGDDHAVSGARTERQSRPRAPAPQPTATQATPAPRQQPSLQAQPQPGNMLPETEQFYLNEIKKAVAAKDIDKALTLVNEAERIGSSKARPTFVEAVKNLK